MKIHTLWAWRKSEEGPELLVAWDAVAVDNWREGWENACRGALTMLGDDISDLGHRYVDIEVDYEKIEHLFYPTDIEGEIAA